MRRVAVLLAGFVAAFAAVGISFDGPAAPARALNACEVADSSLDAEEQAFLAIINDYRASNGAGALAVSQNLNRAAAWMVQDMGTQGYFGHTDSLGRDPWTRIVDCGYPIAGGENLAAGTYRSTAGGAFELFQGSPAHNENMLLARYTQIGIARLFVPGSQYGWYWATTFGTTNDAPVQASAPVAEPTAAPVSQPAVQPAAPAEDPPQARIPEPENVFTLQTGTNFVAWTGEETTLDRVVEGSGGKVSIIYRWDAERARWLRYAPGLPWFVQSLYQVAPGEGMWVIADGPAELQLDG